MQLTLSKSNTDVASGGQRPPRRGNMPLLFDQCPVANSTLRIALSLWISLVLPLIWSLKVPLPDSDSEHIICQTFSHSAKPRMLHLRRRRIYSMLSPVYIIVFFLVRGNWKQLYPCVMNVPRPSNYTRPPPIYSKHSVKSTPTTH